MAPDPKNIAELRGVASNIETGAMSLDLAANSFRNVLAAFLPYALYSGAIMQTYTYLMTMASALDDISQSTMKSAEMVRAIADEAEAGTLTDDEIEPGTGNGEAH